MNTLETVLLAATLVTVTTVFIVAGVLSGNRSHRQRIDEVCHKYILTYRKRYSYIMQGYRMPVGVEVFRTLDGKYVYMNIYEDKRPSEPFWGQDAACMAAVKRYCKDAIL